MAGRSGIGGTAQLNPREETVLVGDDDADAPSRGVQAEEQHQVRPSAVSVAASPLRRLAHPSPCAVTSTRRSSSSSARAKRTCSRSAGSTRRDRLAPLDHDDTAFEQFFETQIVQLLDPNQPIHVDVRERQPARVFLHDRERRTRHRLGDAEPAREALHEGRLPGAEVAAEHDEIADVQQCPDRFTEGFRHVRVARRQRVHQPT